MFAKAARYAFFLFGRGAAQAVVDGFADSGVGGGFDFEGGVALLVEALDQLK
jgi:hypothetical protein